MPKAAAVLKLGALHRALRQRLAAVAAIGAAGVLLPGIGIGAARARIILERVVALRGGAIDPQLDLAFR